MELINKCDLIAEINKRIMDAPINYIGHQRVWAYNDVKDIISTLDESTPPFQMSAADRGVIDEIIIALKAFGKEKMISYDKEIELLENIRKLQFLWMKL